MGVGTGLASPHSQSRASRSDSYPCERVWEPDANGGAEELERVGERIINLERMFNVREGVRRTPDVLPWKVMHEPIPEGPSAGMYCPPEELDAMLDEYYLLRG